MLIATTNMVADRTIAACKGAVIGIDPGNENITSGRGSGPMSSASGVAVVIA